MYGDETEDDRQGAAFAVANAGNPDLDVLAQRVRDDFGGGEGDLGSNLLVGFGGLGWRLLDVSAHWSSLLRARLK